ncbi:hypothetical protein, partial [Nocardia tengchongensis]|uniref:hypothetical protein n=1 Tax=Nocardia tengchongensis TaxID=2055889 RepID=UPI003693CCA9
MLRRALRVAARRETGLPAPGVPPVPAVVVPTISARLIAARSPRKVVHSSVAPQSAADDKFSDASRVLS